MISEWKETVNSYIPEVLAREHTEQSAILLASLLYLQEHLPTEHSKPRACCTLDNLYQSLQDYTEAKLSKNENEYVPCLKVVLRDVGVFINCLKQSVSTEAEKQLLSNYK